MKNRIDEIELRLQILEKEIQIPTLSFLSQYNHLVKQQYTIFTGDCF